MPNPMSELRRQHFHGPLQSMDDHTVSWAEIALIVGLVLLAFVGGGYALAGVVS